MNGDRERGSASVEQAGLAGEPLSVPEAASDEQLLQAHSASYLARVKSGELSAEEQRRIGFPWSPAMVARSRHSAGATLAACRSALAHGCGINLAGVKMIIELQAQLDALRAETDELQERLREREHDAGSEGKIVPLTSVFLPPWQGRPRS